MGVGTGRDRRTNLRPTRPFIVLFSFYVLGWGQRRLYDFTSHHGFKEIFRIHFSIPWSSRKVSKMSVCS
jgi:hypothetical protein